MNILDYVDIDLSWKRDKPIFKFLIKEEKKITQDFPIKCIVNNKKISKTGEPYYVHYLGNIGIDVYRERKKLFSLYSLIPFYIKHYNKNVVELNNYLEVLHANNSKGLVNLYKTERGELIRKKQSDWSTAHSKEISTRNKMLWKDGVYVKKAMNRDYSYDNHGKKVESFYSDEKNKEYIKSVMNAPDRIKKISISSKNMWHNAKNSNKELFYRMINSSKNKNYEINGIKLNSIEYTVGILLNTMNLDWKHEQIFNFENTCYLPDFYIESKNLIVECYGDFWHANPKFFTEIQTTHKNRVVKDIWQYDLLKKEIFEKNGYKYLFFWEYDIIENLENIKTKIYDITR
jgi:hypothetical protein